MKRHFFLSLILIQLLTFNIQYSFACTNFLAGKDATVDGSTLVSYAADSYALYGFLNYLPAADHQQGEMRKIYDWDTGIYLGEIPEVPHTYSVIGNMNEHQLTIGETTWGGREELIDTTGVIDYGSLIYIALQRCRTAREAIHCMTDLVAEYGYYSEGESFSIADPNEVWIMEMIGKGVGNKGAVWVATRIPDDCVAAHANQARITTINFKDKKNWLYSKDVVSFAREKGYFTGKDSEFSFSDTYNPLDFSGAYVCEARVWSFFRQVNSDMEQYFDYVIGKSDNRMPLYIRPERKVSAQDFQHFMRDQYEGTPLDITQGTDAGPWHTKLRYGSLTYTLDSVVYWYERPTATQQTGWSFVAQMRGYMPDHIGGILWFGVDDAATNVYMPFYCRTNAVPNCLKEGNGDLYTYSETSAFWAFNWVANWAYSKYDQMLPDIQAEQARLENYYLEQTLAMDKAALEMSPADAQTFLTTFSCNAAEQIVTTWQNLGKYLLVKYLDGQQRKEITPDGKLLDKQNTCPVPQRQFKRNAAGMPVSPHRPAFHEDFLRKISPEILHE